MQQCLVSARLVWLRESRNYVRYVGTEEADESKLSMSATSFPVQSHCWIRFLSAPSALGDPEARLHLQQAFTEGPFGLNIKSSVTEKYKLHLSTFYNNNTALK